VLSLGLLRCGTGRKISLINIGGTNEGFRQIKI
jgi:hypothetical protein